MSKVVFKLNSDGIGVGYKAIPREYIKLTKSGFKLKGIAFDRQWRKQWTIAENNYNNLEYPCGFHIFLNKRGAEAYAYHSWSDMEDYIVRVEFKDVLAFGYNEGNTFKSRSSFKCIVANKMRIVALEE